MVDTLDNGEIPDNLTDHDECRVHSPQPIQRGETDLGHTPGTLTTAQLLRELSCHQIESTF